MTLDATRILDHLQGQDWDATVWVNGNYVTGRVDPADQRRIVATILEAVSASAVERIEADIAAVGPGCLDCDQSDALTDALLMPRERSGLDLEALYERNAIFHAALRALADMLPAMVGGLAETAIHRQSDIDARIQETLSANPIIEALRSGGAFVDLAYLFKGDQPPL